MQLESFKVELFRITYHRNRLENSREQLGTLLIEASNAEIAGAQGRRKYPTANCVRIFDKRPPLNGWQWLLTDYAPTMAEARPYADRHPPKKPAPAASPLLKAAA